MIDKILKQIEEQANWNNKRYNKDKDEWYLAVHAGLLKAKEIILAARKESQNPKEPTLCICRSCKKPLDFNKVQEGFEYCNLGCAIHQR